MTLSHSPFTTFCTRLTPYVGAKLVSEVRVNYWTQCLCMLPSTTWDQHCLLLPSFQPLIQWSTSHTNLVQQCKCYKNIDSKGVKCARLPHQPHLQQYESDWENNSHPRQSQSVWLQKLFYLFLQFILWFHIIKCVSLFTFYRFQAIKCARRQPSTFYGIEIGKK